MEHNSLTAEQRVEAYLDQVLIPLIRRLSPFHRAELRRELRAHLWERIEAYQELGQPEDDAVTEALQQFGGAEDFTRQWKQEWTKTEAISARTLRLWEAGKAALKPSLAGVATAFLPFTAITSFYQAFHNSAAGAFLFHYGDALYLSWIGMAFVVLPTVIGIQQGRRQPKYAGAGMAAVLIVEIAVVSLFYQLIDGVMYDHWYAESLCSVLLALGVAWLPVAGGAAALSGWWTRRTQQRSITA